VGDKFFQLCAVVFLDHRARHSSLRLVGHEEQVSPRPATIRESYPIPGSEGKMPL
jgi:hypothetical protein